MLSLIVNGPAEPRPGSLRATGQLPSWQTVRLNIDAERWKPVKGLPRYAVSSFGRIRNVQTQRHLTPSLNCYDKGAQYLRVGLYGETGRKMFYVHRLVAMHFCEGYSNLHREVDHLDGDPFNNRASNLEWVTRHENLRRRRYQSPDWQETGAPF